MNTVPAQLIVGTRLTQDTIGGAGAASIATEAGPGHGGCCDLECCGGGPSIHPLSYNQDLTLSSSLALAAAAVIDGSHFLHKKCEKGLIDHHHHHHHHHHLCPDLI